MAIRLSDGKLSGSARTSGTTQRKSMIAPALAPKQSSQPVGSPTNPWHAPLLLPQSMAPANNPTPAPPPPPSMPFTGMGGGGGGALAAAEPAPAAPAPQAMKDVDWFNQDGMYRQAAGGALADLTEQLANILAQRDQAYLESDRAREGLGRARVEDLQMTAGNFSNRGLKDSGFFAQETDRVGEEYARRGSEMDNMVAQLAQQMGQRNAKVDLSTLGKQANNGMGDLSSIFGLLGSMGVGAGNAYNRSLVDARNQSAGRASVPLIQTFRQ